MSADLQQHLEQGRDALLEALRNRTSHNMPYTELRDLAKILVEEGLLSLMAGAGVLVKDGRVVQESWKKVTSA